MLLATFAMLPLCGCQTAGYYTQAVLGHCQIMSRQRSCERLLAAPETSTELRRKLILARDLCAFAEGELGLPSNGAYRRYADLERRYVVWNVYAAPGFSLEPRTWWYPFVGSLDYRGYFKETLAARYAARLARQGWDVHVEGVEAYSTLGWFNDPLLNTFLHHEPAIVAEVLFHELAHQKLFASGDTDFNEAFATTVAQTGVRRWLASKGATEPLARYESALARNETFVRIVEHARRELESQYQQLPDGVVGPGARAAKQEVMDALRADFEALRATSDAYAGYEAWFAGDLNNATLNSVATYYHLVPAFQQMLTAHQGDLTSFYATVKALSKLPKTDRHARLAQARVGGETLTLSE